jgi:hypothetical protein
MLHRSGERHCRQFSFFRRLRWKLRRSGGVEAPCEGAVFECEKVFLLQDSQYLENLFAANHCRLRP